MNGFLLHFSILSCWHIAMMWLVSLLCFSQERHPGDSKNYNECIRHETMRVAVCDMLEGKVACPEALWWEQLLLISFFSYYFRICLYVYACYVLVCYKECDGKVLPWILWFLWGSLQGEIVSPGTEHAGKLCFSIFVLIDRCIGCQQTKVTSTPAR